MAKKICMRTAAIVSLVVASLMCVFFIITIAASSLIGSMIGDIVATDPSLSESGVSPETMASMTMGVMIAMLMIFILFNVALIVINAVLIKKYASKGLGVTATVLGIIAALTELVLFGSSVLFIITGVLRLGAAVTTICGLSLTDNSARAARASSVSYVGVDPAAIDPFADVTDPSRPYVPPQKTSSLDAELDELRKLRDMGVISEEQYRSAVDSAVKRSLGISDDKDKK